MAELAVRPDERAKQHGHGKHGGGHNNVQMVLLEVAANGHDRGIRFAVVVVVHGGRTELVVHVKVVPRCVGQRWFRSGRGCGCGCSTAAGRRRRCRWYLHLKHSGHIRGTTQDGRIRGRCCGCGRCVIQLLVVSHAFAQLAIVVRTLLVAVLARPIAVLVARTKRTVLPVALWTTLASHRDGPLARQWFAQAALAQLAAVDALARGARVLRPSCTMLKLFAMELRVARRSTAFVLRTAVSRPEAALIGLHLHLAGTAHGMLAFGVAHAELASAAMLQLDRSGLAFVQVTNARFAGYDLDGFTALEMAHGALGAEQRVRQGGVIGGAGVGGVLVGCGLNDGGVGVVLTYVQGEWGVIVVSDGGDCRELFVDGSAVGGAGNVRTVFR